MPRRAGAADRPLEQSVADEDALFVHQERDLSRRVPGNVERAEREAARAQLLVGGDLAVQTTE